MNLDIQIQISTWRARAWIRLMRLIAPVVGPERAVRWAIGGGKRLLRYRVFGKRWHRFAP